MRILFNNIMILLFVINIFVLLSYNENVFICNSSTIIRNKFSTVMSAKNRYRNNSDDAMLFLIKYMF